MIAHDSMGGNNTPFLFLLFHFLADKHLCRKGIPLPGKWSLFGQPPYQCPRQANGGDCGVYTCMFADLLSLGHALDFTPDHVQNHRKRLALALWQRDKYNVKRPFGCSISKQRRQKNKSLISIPQNSSNTIELLWKFETQHEVQVLSSPMLPSTVYLDFRPPTSKANQLKGNNHHNKQVERLLVDHDIMCVKGKRFRFKGTFSSPRGDYCASIHVSFDELKHPFDLDLKCQEHPTLISKEICPCKCLLNMNKEIRNWIKFYPCGDDWNLFPVVHHAEVAKDTVKDANNFLLCVKIW